MSIRSADATIKGYFYQFNKTIEELLSLKKEDDSLLVEGIEDIDINSIDGIEAVQCKYYSSQALTNSAIREPIILMLDHYTKSETSTLNRYTLYGYFKNEPAGAIKSYTLSELKLILTYKEKGVEKKYYQDHNITDTTLNSFLKKFTLFTGKDFDDHKNDCIKLIRQVFQCTEFEAENYYYNNAVRVIFDLAIEKKEIDRAISKKVFLQRIDCGKVMFYAWYKRYSSKEKYISLIKKGLKDVNLFSPAKDKLLFLGKGVDFNSSAMPLPSFLESIVCKYYQLGHAKYSSRPVTVVIDVSDSDLLNVKKALIKQQISFNDGREGILFNSDEFCSDPIINRSPSGNGKIIKASFVLRIISKQAFDLHHANFSKLFSVLAISEEDFNYPNFKITQLIEAKYFTSLTDINSIL